MNMRDDLKAFIDNEVSEEERTRILKEAENDPALQAELIELRQVSRVIKEEAWQPEPVGLERTLRALEAAKSKRPWWLGPSFHWAIGGACTVMIVAIFSPMLANTGFQAEESLPATGASSPMAKTSKAESSNTPFKAKLEDPVVNSPAPTDSRTKSALKPEAPAGGSGQVPASVDHFAGRVGRAYTREGLTVPVAPQASVEGVGDGEKTADFSLEVDNIAEAQHKAQEIAKNLNGRSENKLKDDENAVAPREELTLKVPRSNFGQAVEQVRKLGKARTLSPERAAGASGAGEPESFGNPMKPVDIAPLETSGSKLKNKDSQVGKKKPDMRFGSGKEDATINLSLTEREKSKLRYRDSDVEPKVASPLSEEFDRSVEPGGNPFVLAFKYSPIWMPVILIAWWIARRRAGAG